MFQLPLLPTVPYIQIDVLVPSSLITSHTAWVLCRGFQILWKPTSFFFFSSFFLLSEQILQIKQSHANEHKFAYIYAICSDCNMRRKGSHAHTDTACLFSHVQTVPAVFPGHFHLTPLFSKPGASPPQPAISPLGLPDNESFFPQASVKREGGGPQSSGRNRGEKLQLQSGSNF